MKGLKKAIQKEIDVILTKVNLSNKYPKELLSDMILLMKLDELSFDDENWLGLS